MSVPESVTHVFDEWFEDDPNASGRIRSENGLVVVSRHVEQSRVMIRSPRRHIHSLFWVFQLKHQFPVRMFAGILLAYPNTEKGSHILGR